MEIFKVPIESEPGNSIVQRVKNGIVETLKETVSTTGESLPDPTNPLITIETITITRRIGETITF